MLRRLHPPAQRPTHLARRQPRLRQRLRLNQIPHSLSLRQINAAQPETPSA